MNDPFTYLTDVGYPVHLLQQNHISKGRTVAEVAEAVESMIARGWAMKDIIAEESRGEPPAAGASPQAEKPILTPMTTVEAVRVCWVDQQPTECGAVEAVRLCSDRYVSGRIVGVVARDKALEDVLNKLLDGE